MGMTAKYNHNFYFSQDSDDDFQLSPKKAKLMTRADQVVALLKV